MATWADVRRIASTLPETSEVSSRGLSQLERQGQGLAWERPLRRADLEALGDEAPDGPVLAAHVPDLGAKEALLAEDPGVYFTTPHFDGYPAILVRLDTIDVAELEELVVEAWLARRRSDSSGPTSTPGDEPPSVRREAATCQVRTAERARTLGS